MRLPSALLLALGLHSPLLNSTNVAGALSASHANDVCPPLSTFACPATRSALLSSSWCAASNPLVFPQPPEVRDASASGGDALRPQCAGGGDPFGDCTLIDKFAATEVVGIGGAKVKLLAITERTDGGANASLSFFDERLVLLATPVAGFRGRLNLLDTASGPPLRGAPTNASTLLIGYGGTRSDFPSSLLMFEVFNTSQTVADGVFLPEFAFIGAGVYEVPAATALDFSFFTASVNATAAAAAGLPEGESTFAALTVVREGAGVSVLFYGLLPDTSPVCSNPHVISPCFAEMGEWALFAGGLRVTNAPVQVRFSDAWAACTQPAGATAAISAAYTPFYNSASCAVRTTIVGISSGTTVSTLAFSPSPGATFRVDLDVGISARAFDSSVFAPAASAPIVDFAIVSSRSLVAPDIDAGVAVAAPPASVWLIVITGTPNVQPNQSPDARLFAVGLGAFSRDRSAAAAAAAERGNPAAAPIECPGWGYYWNGTQCTGSAVRNVFGAGGLDVGGVSIKAAWRALSPALAAPLVAAGCMWYNETCVGDMISSLVGGQSASPPQLRADTTALVLGWRARLDAGNSLGSIVDDLIAAVAGDRFVVFVALTSRQIAVLELTPMPPCSIAADVDSLGAAVSLDNVLQLAGSASSLHVTPNAQYVFASTVRPRFALESMNRAVDICDARAASPGDPFLASYSDMCDGMGAPPRRPVTADFLLVATACLPGSLCPSFNDETVADVPAGFFTALGFSAVACAPGTYCTGGRAIACPPGFMCPTPSLALPVPCGYDNSLTTTCSSAGTVVPAPCPDGSLCTAPYLPPLPAPPGFATNTTVFPNSATGGNYTFRGLSPCALGDWCGYGRAEPTTGAQNATLLSPAGTFTSAPGALQPVMCDFGGDCNASACPVMPFCPAGSSSEAPCPAGFYCETTEVATPCRVGTYCPAGSTLWVLCPARSFCPSPSVIVECPRGSYCPAGVSAPVKCTVLMDCACDGGCEAPPLSVPATTTGGVVFIAGLFFLARWAVRRRRAGQGVAAVAPVKSVAGVSRDEESGVDTAALLEPSPSSSLNGGGAVILARTAPLPKRAHRLSVSFSDLHVDLFSGKRVLEGVSGSLRAGRVTAIMGPSGAGKTTLLSAVAGKVAAYGNMGGVLSVNGTPVRSLADERVRHLVGFVPQEDVMLRDQTVESIIHFAATTRLPASLPVAAKRAHADAVIDVLGLGEIRGCVIGDELTRGISGGQRKRVNIGIELAADPLVLLLDEPTSGLDAAASLDVCAALQRIAASGVTVALVLHQPRFEIFSSFDDLILLAKGGSVAYAGPVTDALAHVEGCGFVCPPLVNPADFIVDVVGTDAAVLTGLWKGGGRDVGSGGGGRDDNDGTASLNTLPPRDPLPAMVLAAHFCIRSLRQQRATPSVVIVNLLFVCAAAMFLAWLYVGTPSFAAPAPIETFAGCAPRVALAAQNCLAEAGDDVLNRSVMAVIAVSLTGVATALRVFAAERAVYFREAAALPQPSATVAYFLGKDVASLPQVVASALTFTIAYGALATPRASFFAYFVAFLGVNFCASALGHLTAVLAPPALAQLVGVVGVFANAQFAGGAPTLVALRAKAPPLCWLPTLSYARYALEALYTAEVREYSEAVALEGVDQAEMVRENFGYNIDAFVGDVWVLFGIGVALRGIACFAMVACDGRKKM